MRILVTHLWGNCPDFAYYLTSCSSGPRRLAAASAPYPVSRSANQDRDLLSLIKGGGTMSNDKNDKFWSGLPQDRFDFLHYNVGREAREAIQYPVAREHEDSD